MATRLENGEFTDYSVSPQMVEPTDQLLTTINNQTNNLIDEMNIREYIDTNSSIIATYQNGYCGPRFCTSTSENLYDIRISNGNRHMILEYNTEDKIVERIINHNFDENGYKKTMGEWLEGTILAGLEDARKKEALVWFNKDTRLPINTL